MRGAHGQVTLDDDFVLDQLRPVAERWPALVVSPGRMAQIGRRVERKIQRCLALFRKHHGLARRRRRPPDVQKLEELLIRALKILGKVLRLEDLIPAFERVIETDWLAHVELVKEKRYRDHITHPVRVTAVGWWLLHRARGRVLARLAKHYERETAPYRACVGIDIGHHDWPGIVEYAWLACGLLHDSAYSLEYHLRSAKRLGKSFGHMLAALDPSPNGSSAPRAADALLRPLEGSWLANQEFGLRERTAQLCDGGLGHPHSLLGALHALSPSASRLNSLKGLVVQIATRAIAVHHDDRDEHILSDPMAVLLFAADNLQSWQRPFLHRDDPASPDGSRTVRTLIECQRIELVPEGDGYLATLLMSASRDDWALLKRRPYNWDFERFRGPNRRVERLIRRSGLLPHIVLSQRRCIVPRSFLPFMER